MSEDSKNPTITYAVFDQNERGEWRASIETNDFDRMVERIREIVGGWFDVARLPNGQTAYVNDTGLIDNRPLNPYAAGWFGRALYGSMVVTGAPDNAGYDTDIPNDVRVAVETGEYQGHTINPAIIIAR